MLFDTLFFDYSLSVVSDFCLTEDSFQLFNIFGDNLSICFFILFVIITELFILVFSYKSKVWGVFYMNESSFSVLSFYKSYFVLTMLYDLSVDFDFLQFYSFFVPMSMLMFDVSDGFYGLSFEGFYEKSPSMVMLLEGFQWGWYFSLIDLIHKFFSLSFSFRVVSRFCFYGSFFCLLIEFSTYFIDYQQVLESCGFVLRTEDSEGIMDVFEELLINCLVLLPFGEYILILLTSMDVMHSFFIPRLGVKLDVVPGHLNSLYISLVDCDCFECNSLSLEGYCAEFCGVNHAFMGFSLEFVDVFL